MKKIPTTIKSLIIAGMFVAGVSTAIAFTPPAGTPPSSNVLAPITIGVENAVKQGGIVAKSLIAGSGIVSSATAPINGYDSFIMAKKIIASPYGLFESDHALIAGKTSKVKIGSSGIAAPLIGSQYTTPLTLDLTGRTSSTVSARTAAELISGNSCNVSIGTNTGAIRFVDNQSPDDNNDDRSRNINLIGRQVRLSGGNADALRVLVATNDKGDAVWGTMEIVNGQLKVNYGQSPVTGIQGCIDVPPPAPSCPSGQSWNGSLCICNTTGNPPANPPTYPSNRGVQITNCDASGVCTPGIKVQTPPVLLRKLRNANGTPASMPNKCVLATKQFDACSDGDMLEELYVDSSGATYPIYSGTGSNAGKYEVVSSLGDSCSESSTTTPAGTPYNTYQVTVFP